MVDVARSEQLRPDVDYHIDYQLAAWNSVREYAAWWPDLDPLDKEVFQLEWTGITESRLRELQRWAERGYLSPEQQGRYRQLVDLVEDVRPVLDKLFVA